MSETTQYRLASLILAAGQSRRYKGNKLLDIHPQSNTPLIVHSTNELLHALEQIHGNSVIHYSPAVVAGRWFDNVKTSVAPLPVKVVQNQLWEEGIGASIRCGVERMSNHNAILPTHLLITLGDLAKVDKNDFIRLIKTSIAQPKHIVCSHWLPINERINGHKNVVSTVPAIFPCTAFSDLVALTGDTGAKCVIKHWMQEKRVTGVAVPNAAFDIDTPEDWAYVRTAPEAR